MLLIAFMLLALAQAMTSEASSPQPVGNPGDWVGVDDYPAEALRAMATGIVAFELRIGPDVWPSGCELTETSTHPVLDAATCSLVMTRARFTWVPGGGTCSNRVRWVLPDDGPDGDEQAPADGVIGAGQPVRDGLPIPPPALARMVLKLDAQGLVETCVIQSADRSGRNPVEGGLTCPKGPFEPVRDAADRPVPLTVTIQQEVTVTPR